MQFCGEQGIINPYGKLPHTMKETEKGAVRLKRVSTLQQDAVFLAAYAATEKHGNYDHSFNGHFMPKNTVKRNGHNHENF